MTLRFADAHHGRLDLVTNWGAFLGSVDGLIFKCTQGTSFADPAYRSALARARGAGKLTAHYHFVGPGASSAPASPAAEASWFLQHLDWRPGEPLVTDWEPGVKPADSDGWLAEFNGRVRAALGPVPWSYMNSFEAKRLSWAKTRAGDSALWVAQYGINNGQPNAAPLVGSWSGYAAWQYTSAGVLPGISGGTDLSLFYGTPAAWRAYGTPAPSGGLTLANVSDADATRLVQSVDLLVQQLMGPGYTVGQTNDAPGWPTERFGRDVQEAHTVVSYLQALDRQANSVLDLTGRPFDPSIADTELSHVLSMRAELAKLSSLVSVIAGSDTGSTPQQVATALVSGLPADVVDALRGLLAAPA